MEGWDGTGRNKPAADALLGNDQMHLGRFKKVLSRSLDGRSSHFTWIYVYTYTLRTAYHGLSSNLEGNLSRKRRGEGRKRGRGGEKETLNINRGHLSFPRGLHVQPEVN